MCQFYDRHIVSPTSLLMCYNCVTPKEKTSMNQVEVEVAIENALSNLYNLNEMIYDYWVSELYDTEEQRIDEKWNEEVLSTMELDVMQQSNL